ncbi:hypothetical protein HY439_03405 [Candidatus Microgenomates bacterium]|nr:hypothetical protein [Candidatus Microgenomates bacterium]
MQIAFIEEKIENETTLATCTSPVEEKEGNLQYISVGTKIFEVWKEPFSSQIHILL